jgi:predicted nucleotidyltransferase
VEFPLKVNKTYSGKIIIMNNELSPIKIEYEPRLATLEQYEIQSQAVDIAGLCARMLKREFAVEKVILFGSMIYPEDIVYGHNIPKKFISDIDLAIFGGLPDQEFWNGYIKARNACNDMARYAHRFLNLPSFEVDLVLANTMDEDMLEQINDGIELCLENSNKSISLADLNEKMYD